MEDPQAHRADRANGRGRANGHAPPPLPPEAEPVDVPEHLVPLWDSLDPVWRALMQGPLKASDNPREFIRVCVANLRRLPGCTLEVLIELAGCLPHGLGCLGDEHTGPAIHQEWRWADEAEAKARQERAEAEAKAAKLYDPWADPAPPEWPGGVLSREAEDTIAALSLGDGVDFGAQALAYIAAASGAAPKDARFAPYPHSRWSVPPIIWIMLIADSGQRKTAILGNAFTALQRRNAELWRDYSAESQRWRALGEDEKRAGGKPREPHSFIVSDVTPEKLQMILAANPRGTLLLKDELASLFDFGRYGASGGGAERAFYLEAYEGQAYTSHRVGRDTVHIQNAGLTIYGGIQPDRLAAFKDLESDGLLQRFVVMRPARAAISRPGVAVPNKGRLDDAIDRLATLIGQTYRATPEAAELIRQTEIDGAELATIPDFGKGFQGFASKLCGTHARLALILHLLESPEHDLVPNATIERAGRLVRRFLLPHARDFYGTLPDSSLPLIRDIAGWLLTKAPGRVVASDLTSGVKACRGMGSKRLAEAVDPLVTGGWLDPEDPYPANRAWLVNPDLRAAFAERAKTEKARRSAIRALIGRIEKPDFPDSGA